MTLYAHNHLFCLHTDYLIKVIPAEVLRYNPFFGKNELFFGVTNNNAKTIPSFDEPQAIGFTAYSDTPIGQQGAAK
ncbi:MAG: hypothetical protein JW795_14715 [Chitinivibrionales bacterium]|nr:hypothetical protein [Chitinivibrionales bacterium]